jgi:hypothetical protein
MSQQYFSYKNKKYLIYKGTRGGLFIILNNKKNYIKTINKQVGGNIPKVKTVKVIAKINGIKRVIYERKNVSDKTKYTPIFESCEDINEHIEFMSKLSQKNKWFYSDNRTNKPRYYGSCFKWDKKKKAYVQKQEYSISEIMESWLKEQLSIECKFALLIFWYLKIYRIYGNKINDIVKTIECKECKKNPFNLRSSKNIDGKPFFQSSAYLYFSPQKDTSETNKLFDSIKNDYTFGYIRSNFGYLPLKKVGTKEYTRTSPQGHNFMLSCHNNKPRICVFGPIDIYEPELKIDNPENAYGKYLIINDIKSFLNKAFREGLKVINESVENSNKIPKDYKLIIDGNKVVTKSYKEWFGLTQIFNKFINLPKNF